MPGRRVSRPDDIPFSNRTTKRGLQLLGGILERIGHPLYFLLSALLIALAILTLWVGRIALLLIKALSEFAVFFCRVFTFITATISKKKIKVRRPPLRFLLPKLKIQIPVLRVPRRFKLIGAVLSVLILLVVSFWFWVLKDLPRPGELVTRDQAVTTKIYDRNGELLFKVFRNQNRTLLRLKEVPLYTRQATIAIEDSSFYSHTGFSIRGMLRAVVRNITQGEVSGGSTITQQLVKNALLSPEKTLTRKLRELILAIQVELAFSKDQILEMYLNEVAYGGAAYGIEEAAQLYFGKSARELTLAESALLAGLPKAPTTYSPFGANPQFAKARQLEVLSRMVQEGYLIKEEAQEAARVELVFAPQRTDIKAPHFVMYVKEILAQKYGAREVEEGGFEVITSLDLKIQELVEQVVKEEVEKLGRLSVSNGAALVTNPQTGEILAMVGSRDYFDQVVDGNFNVTTALRQPGSSIKPVNYSYALESGRFTAASIISDTPITYLIPGTDPYSPRNYDSAFHGNVTLRTALGSSFNVPAVKVLASYGVDKMLKQGQELGITTWEDPKRFGLSLTLGGGEVKMTDMAVVYGTLANYGKRAELTPILQVKDYKGRVLEENTCHNSSSGGNKVAWIKKARAAVAAIMEGCGEQVLDSRVAFILTDILRDNIARTPAFGSRSLLNIPGHEEVAVKTGTTQNLRDNWAIGYTKDFVVSAWVGNNDNQPMSWVASGVTGATPIWNRIMSGLLASKPNHSWEVPEGISQVQICTITGTLPCEGCPTKTEYFIKGTEPTQSCNLQEYFERQGGERQGEIL